MGLLIPLVLFALMYTLFILPQKRKLRAHQELVSRVAPGDDIMTTSGMYGTVVAIDGDDVQFEVAPGVEIRLVRGAIARVVESEAADDSGYDDQTDEPDTTDAVDDGVAGDDANGVR